MSTAPLEHLMRSLSACLAVQDMTNDVEHTGAGEVRALLLAEIDRTSAISAAARSRDLRLWVWMARRPGRLRAGRTVQMRAMSTNRL